MNTITPIPIIIHHHDPKCPKCGRDESIVETCEHCGYVYEPDDGPSDGKIVLVAIPTILFAMWLICTIGYWAMDLGYDHATLVDVLKSQWSWLVELFGRIA